MYGIDYLKTFAPVAKLVSLRLLLSIAVKYNLEVHQMDVKSASLAGDLDEVIYMAQPEGFVVKGGLICKLIKSLYGLKQSPRQWNNKIHQFLVSIGSVRTNADHCVYINTTMSVIIAMWVNDLMIFAKDKVTINDVKSKLNESFNMKDLGELEYFLGIQVN